MIVALPLIVLVLLLILASAAVGIVLLIRSTRYVEASPHCLKCDYDLRHRSSDSPVCPECGEPIASAIEGVKTSRRLFILGMIALAGVPAGFGLLAAFAFVFI